MPRNIFGQALTAVTIMASNDRLDFQYWRGRLFAGLLIGALAALCFGRLTHTVFGSAVFVAVLLPHELSAKPGYESAESVDVPVKFPQRTLHQHR